MWKVDLIYVCVCLLSENSLLVKGVYAVLTDDSFKLPFCRASSVLKTAKHLANWIPNHHDEVSFFEKNLIASLSGCMQGTLSAKKGRERMWSLYHSLRTSDDYVGEWCTFLQRSGASEMSSIFYQYVGDYMFKQLIKLHHPLHVSEFKGTDHSTPTYEEKNAIRYAAGYVPRSLKKKILKSAHPLKEDIQLCILDLLDDGDEYDNESKDWVRIINHGGLTQINNTTYELFVSVECELRKHLSKQVPNFDAVQQAIIRNENVHFLWSILSADWEDKTVSALLQMVISEWVKIRGFSYASCWIEKYKSTQRKTLQKSKGVRKQLLANPNWIKKANKNFSGGQDGSKHH